MVVRESHLAIRKVLEPILAIDRPRMAAEGIPSPKSPLERDARSPRGWRNRHSAGVGLAIVAALDRLGGAAPSSASAAAAAAPIAIGAGAAPRSRRNRGRFEVAESGGCGGACSASACGFKEIRSDGDVGAEFPLLDFLNCCYLCRKRLHGKDIYIYKGEKAFCSMECRYSHIASEECQESFIGSDRVRRKSAAREIASTPPQSCSGGPLFFTGVVVA